MLSPWVPAAVDILLSEFAERCLSAKENAPRPVPMNGLPSLADKENLTYPALQEEHRPVESVPEQVECAA